MFLKKKTPDTAIYEIKKEIENEEPKIKESEKIWDVQELPTQTSLFIINHKTGEKYDILLGIVEILNKLEKFESG